jgi:hypothetical protein
MKGKLTVLMITAFVDMLGLAMIIPDAAGDRIRLPVRDRDAFARRPH